MGDDGNIVSLDRVRALKEFDGDDKVLYVEMLWGTKTYGVHVAIRDLEAMRAGQEDPTKPLRDPGTVHEAQVAIDHIRWMANCLAREWGLEESVRTEDWQGDERPKPEDTP